MNFNQLKNNLSKAGDCPLCGKFFKGLKLHFNTCFKKHGTVTNNSNFNNSNNKFDSNSHSISTNNNLVYDSVKCKWKCEFCDKFYFKDLSKKHYLNHLNKYHSLTRSTDDFIEIISNDYFDSTEALVDDLELDEIFDDDQVELVNSEWLQTIISSMIPKNFNFIHLNINSVLGPTKYAGLNEILIKTDLDLIIIQESKISTETPDLLFDFVNYELIRRDRCKGGGGIMVLKKMSQNN